MIRLDRSFRGLGALAVVMLLQAPASAHHSLAGEFDTTKPMVLSGVVSKVQWVNPHIYIDLAVTDPAGKVVSWHLECVPVAMARKAGVSAKMLMGNGERVTVDAFPARDGTEHLGFMAKITYADGHHVQFIQNGQTTDTK